MKTKLGALIAVVALCGRNKGTEPAAETPAKVEPAAAAAVEPHAKAGNTVVDVAVGSKDHTTLVAALKAADLVVSLASPGGVYTVFAPTNGAFDKLPKGTVEDLLKPEKKGALTAILKHHAAVPALQLKDMRDGESLSMADGKKVTFHVKDGKVMIGDATIVATIQASNGVVHVVDGVILP
jgi:uncharacterized surface protein with fasciclin (FAS1) repeats